VPWGKYQQQTIKGGGGAMKARGDKRHFTAEELADFARKAGPEGQLKAMKQHLESCGKCAKAANTWRRVAEVAHRLPAPEPPESAVRLVKAFYSTNKPEKTPRLKSLVANLLFDSSLVPLQAGVRSSAATPRQLLFGSGDYHVDLRIEPQDDADMVSLLGQILHASDPTKNLGAVSVCLIAGRRVLATSQTNHLGEFQMECDLTPRLELRVTLPDSQVSIPLVEPLRDGVKENPYLTVTKVFKDISTRKKP
jgi:hypothetical protein